MQLTGALRRRSVRQTGGLVNKADLQRKFFAEKGASFQNLRIVCEMSEDLQTRIQETAALLNQSYRKPSQSQSRPHVFGQAVDEGDIVDGECHLQLLWHDGLQVIEA